MKKSYLAEFIGTTWFVLGGCGTMVIAGQTVGPLGVALAFGLSYLSMAYAISYISGCHLNPAITLGLAISGRFEWRQVFPYTLSQFLGAILGASLLYFVASGREFFNVDMGFAANGYEGMSLHVYNLFSAFLIEFILTFFLVLIFIGSTTRRAPSGLSPIAIGLTITLIHLISMPITNASANPARSTSQAIFMGGLAFHQLWLFWLAPIMGAAWAGVVSRLLYKNE